MAIRIFTARDVDQTMHRLGGTGFWKLNESRVSQQKHVLMYRNNDPKSLKMAGESAGDHRGAHGNLFMVGEIRDVVACPSNSSRAGRHLIRFSKFGFLKRRVKYDKEILTWPKLRNPVLYDDDLQLDVSKFDWVEARKDLPLPHECLDPDYLTIEEAKRRLALTLGVDQSAVRISINA